MQEIVYLKEVTCPSVPGLNILQSASGLHFVNCSECVILFTGASNIESARSVWCKFVKQHPCLKADSFLFQDANADKLAYKYKSKAGHITTMLSVSGVEYVVNHICALSPATNENRAKFIELVKEWKTMEQPLGKRPAPSSSAASAPAAKVARIEGGGGVANALVLRSIKTMSAVSGAVTVLNTKMDVGFDRVEGSVLAMTSKVDVVKDRVKQGTTEVRKLAASVDANHRQQLDVKDAQIKKLQEDNKILQAANERQRAQLAKMNKERDELLKAPPSSDPKLLALSVKVDGVARTVEDAHKVAYNSREKMSTLGKDMQSMQTVASAQGKDMQRMQASLSTQAKTMEEIKAFLRIIVGAIQSP
jgi:predicted  nucleic acid-binding Zn-ribbon protein